QRKITIENTNMPSQGATTNLTFKIKLLSGKNVVLVDCPGFESELFMPQIIKGRINFQNIIPDHRCCDAAAANVQTDQLILPGYQLGSLRVLTAPQPINTPQKYSYAGMSNLSVPLARSTPSNGRPGKENVQLGTPEHARCKFSKEAVPPELPGQALDRTIAQLVDMPALNVSNTVMTSPLQFSPNSSLTLSGKSIESRLSKAPPTKTYSRQKSTGTAQLKPPISWSPLPKKKKPSKVSSTKSLSPTMKLEVRHRKLIVDNKKSISPSVLQKPVTKAITKTKIRRMQVTGKTRVQFEALKETAFDLLTLPGLGHVSRSLSNQFKDACLDKYSETLPTYAALSKTAPLQLDRQVKTLIAKEKRLEKQ
ncbi:hypothetical protein KR093_008341, partial [Drosophila rubida]